jgi:hypothetical protein
MLKSDKQRIRYARWNTVHKWKNLDYRFWFGLTTISQNLADWIWCRIRRNEQYESDRKFWDLCRKCKYTLIRPAVQELWSLQFGVLLEISCFLDRSGYLGKFEISAHFQQITDKILNTKVIEPFITFLTIGRTQNLGLKWRNYDQLRLNEILRYDFHFELISSFFWFLTFIRLKGFQSPSYSCTCTCTCKIMTHDGPIHSSPKEMLAQYIRCTYSRWQSHSSP